MAPSKSPSRAVWLAGAGLLLAGAAAAWFFWTRGPDVPQPGTPAYEQASRAFYRGLAALEVGLLDDARQEFGRAAEQVPEEPASWANLGVTQLRLGELDRAAEPIARALALAPDNGALELLAGRMEIARGRVDEGIAHLRRAVERDPDALRARYTLAEETERGGGDGADERAQQMFDELLQRAPDNLAVLLERARLAARRRDAGRLRDSVSRLQPRAQGWPPIAKEQFAALQQAAAAGSFDAAARSTALLRNVLARVPAFIESLLAVRTPAELIAEPFDRFLVMAPPTPMPAAPDAALTYAQEAAGDAPASLVLSATLDPDGTRALFAADAATVRRLDAPGTWPFPGGAGGVAPGSHGVLAADWNFDFRTDLVLAGAGGLRLLAQDGQGNFSDVTGAAGGEWPADCDCAGAWAADVEMDGDLDLIVAERPGPVFVMRNNGDGSWRRLPLFSSVRGVRDAAWGDLDHDADPDAAFIDSEGELRVWFNRQAGEFVESRPAGAPTGLTALAIADADGDGRFDVVTVSSDGILHRVSWLDGRWTVAQLAAGADAAGTPLRVMVGDLDNNGALDLLVSSLQGSRAWLGSGGGAFAPLDAAVGASVRSMADLNGDGVLDLMGLASGRPVRLVGRSPRGYHWKAMRPRAQQRAGDQRINSYGIGGDIEVRSGLLTQKQLLSGGPVHFGLGGHTGIDVARIVWPNGVAQAEFDAGVDDAIVAEQRLKGSCPWVFTFDGEEMRFVTDFLWRSPLGLRINAQDTAGVTQTEDWVRITGEQLAPKDGAYDVRITAELWETHFFDHVSLLAVDHPADTEVFVDERFSATSPPMLAVQAMGALRPVTAAVDDRGDDVTAVVASADGRSLAGFERGRYQGIAGEHAVEFDVPAADGRPRWLVARGWVYPTDSSINVAIGQGQAVKPQGVALEARGADGRWRVVNGDLGFPAGKNKTMLIDLAGVGGATRLRLRTNLEVYWDQLATAEKREAALEQRRLAASTAELRFRGYSRTTSERGDTPETPEYGALANTAQRWRDLVGYYTRYGEVRELLAGVDDRYVIMNAGDELRLRFAALPPPAAGLRRDFVLIGDGWEKDGDYNTGQSQTVLPLPTHARPAYDGVAGALEEDPVYRQHAGDWVEYHTRFVTPRGFMGGLRRR